MYVPYTGPVSAAGNRSPLPSAPHPNRGERAAQHLATALRWAARRLDPQPAVIRRTINLDRRAIATALVADNLRCPSTGYSGQRCSEPHGHGGLHRAELPGGAHSSWNAPGLNGS